MKIKDIVGGLVATFFCGAMCVQCTNMHLEGSDTEAISRYEKLISEQATAVAKLHPEYKEVTLTVLKVPIKTFNFTYSFDVDGRSYTGEKTYQIELPKTDTLTVNYLREDPSINCSEPEKLLESEKENGASKTNLIAAIIWGVLAALTLLGVFASFKEKNPDPQ